MEIKYIGHSSFFIKTKTARVVTDPFDTKMVGIRFPKTEADIVTVSHHHHDHDMVSQIAGNPLILDWPGQFEKMGVRIWGVQTYHDKKKGEERGINIMYKFESEQISILHCGDLGMIPEDSILDEIGETDILFVPVGGTYTLDATEAVELIKKVEPAIVIPMHYGLPEGAIKELAPVSEFLKKMGKDTLEPIDKLVVKKEELLLDQEIRVVLLRL
jgi:L-ascorbate metabolism protein UlaG (beta-lactamase superfamily)